MGSRALAAVLLALASSAYAYTIERFTPQGDVARIEQVRARFSEAMVTFGQQDLPAPFEIECAEKGAGRWLNEREWVFQFERSVPPGTRCRYRLKKGLKALGGSDASGATSFAFATGGPAIVRSTPFEGSRVDEEQAFAFVLSGPARIDSVMANAWCQAEGIGERIPVSAVTDPDRKEILAHLRLRAPEENIVVLRCRQRLPAGAKLTLTWGRGIEATRAGAPTGIRTTVEQRLGFRVRPEFSASLTCERENAKAPCVPVAPIRLQFSLPVERKLAESTVLRTPSGVRRPYFSPDDRENTTDSVQFKGPFPGLAELAIELPPKFADAEGRVLVNAPAFPLKFKTGDLPPLLKFPVSAFGIVELAADASLPVTVRHVEPAFAPPGGAVKAAGEVRVLRLTDDRAAVEWFQRVKEHDESTLRIGGKDVRSREVSLLGERSDARRIQVPPASGERRPFEVIGLPLAEPGYYVVEATSERLGAALLGRSAPMYVRTSALVTNLAVHVKIGAENSLVWVTSLDRGRPVAGAQVRISDCKGAEIWRGITGADGTVRIDRRLASAPSCAHASGWFVSARKADGEGRTDFSFAWSSWNDGIEPFRFGVATGSNGTGTLRAHTVLDRSLLRAGETVQMKHFLRVESTRGLELPDARALPGQATVRHVGSNDEYAVPVAWSANRYGESKLVLPVAAKKGRYRIELAAHESGSFRVEDFRLPVFSGGLDAGRGPHVRVSRLAVRMNLQFIAGGSAANVPVRVSAMLERRYMHFARYEAFSFDPLRGEEEQRLDRKLLADKLALSLDKQGTGTAEIAGIPASKGYYDLVTEATFDDPNGETQTISRRFPLWPSGVVVGIKAEGWTSFQRKAKLQTVILDTEGQPLAGRAVEVRGRLRLGFTHRKRVVGGFYAYEHRTETKDIGTLCSGMSDARGLVFCELDLKTAGNVELIANAKDAAGNVSQAVASVWVTEHGEIWFDVENHDRMDVIPERRAYKPGETARFQVRMPFREATALVAIEREGVIETRVERISGRDPTVSVRIGEAWAPNVYVSVLAVRGRLREAPWYSFFVWGWRSPLDWWTAFRSEHPEWTPPTAFVDLAKPAFRFGVAEIEVGREAHELKVSVVPEKPVYAPRQTARVKVQVKGPGGGALPAGTEVAIAAVDQALLELEPNRSWEVLEAMLRNREYAVETASAQMQVVGKRHYGRKALPAGGGGGRAPTRELFDTLLYWNPRVALDANGEAAVDVPLNDSLTTFTVAAVADAGTSLFGTGRAQLRSTQDLQIVSGLPPLMREGDRFAAALTLRNTTSRAMRVAVDPKVSGRALEARTVELAAGEAREAVWDVTVPRDAQKLDWEIEAKEAGGAARDRIRIAQRVVPVVPLSVRQAKLAQLAEPLSVNVSPPEDAEADAAGNVRGGVAVALAPRLSGDLPGVRRYFELYPFACLEQKVSKALGLRSKELWASLGGELPAYLDGDGLAAYFPLAEGSANVGSETLTAHLLAAAHETGMEVPQAPRERMLRGLEAFVEGKLKRERWSPRRDLTERKLSALEALSRYGRVKPLMLTSIEATPNLWPSSALIDWYAVLMRTPGAQERSARMAETANILRARISYQGTRVVFSSERDDYLWWLMVNGDVNAGRLMVTVMAEPAWREELPRMVLGLLDRQRNGAWSTTTANLWGSLAVEKFGRTFEKDPVSGRTMAALDTSPVKPLEYAWKGNETAAVSLGTLAWGPRRTPAATLPDNAARIARSGVLSMRHEGAGKPWATLLALAAVPPRAPVAAGYRVTKDIQPVEQKVAGAWSKGDIARVTLTVQSSADMTWVVISDPIPAGSSILGGGLGRDSQIAVRGEKREGRGWIAFAERTFEAYRAYYAYLPRGTASVQYTLRINNPGEFSIPATRAEAMYAPEMFGELPNAKWQVNP